ncbi:MAG: fumarate hydratase [Actinobacteria bacterium]|jgi:fumarate hydratase class I|nr:MAG: fumarate hydratase [Acidimicrobium sp. BACL17 MAG-120924-bin0]MDA0193227.1 fumarate hydratase [Actinomycetota bacterium]MDA2952854.1 fumarate hydratase [Actinomycetota bacterium]
MAKPNPAPFQFSELLPLGPDTTEYRFIGTEGVSTFDTPEGTFLKVDPSAIVTLTEHAMRDIAHLLRPGHLQQLADILTDPEASDNDRFVALDLLKNASISAGGVLPMCQDTGTAIVKGKKGQFVFTGGNDEEAISRGVYNTYLTSNLRYSQLAPLSMYEEVNTNTNLPAEIKISAVDGDEYKFLFMAKGGGSANKSYLFQETKALLNEKSLLPWAFEKMKTLGTAACPPYHLAIVIGGTSAEYAVEVAKLASARYLDSLPTAGSALGHAFRDLDLERKMLDLSQQTGIGAQFGGKYFCHDVRVIRLPRHGASCPVAMAVSCSADRQALGKINKHGIFLEQLETDPARFLPEVTADELAAEVVAIDLNKPMSEIRDTLSKYPVKTRVMLTGPMVVARDLAHAKIKERLDAGDGLPQYMKDHCVYYAGPAKTPEGFASGSFGPTTAGRMDSYVADFQAAGGSFVMLAKGNRSRQVTDACNTYGGFYLGSIGGPAARLAQDCITKVDVLEYAELGMEAVWKIEVQDFPAFIVVDDKGNDFFDVINANSGVKINVR